MVLKTLSNNLAEAFTQTMWITANAGATSDIKMPIKPYNSCKVTTSTRQYFELQIYGIDKNGTETLLATVTSTAVTLDVKNYTALRLNGKNHRGVAPTGHAWYDAEWMQFTMELS